jgi:hypothetical protein
MTTHTLVCVLGIIGGIIGLAFVAAIGVGMYRGGWPK